MLLHRPYTVHSSGVEQEFNSMSSFVVIECMVCVQVGNSGRQHVGMSGSAHTEVSVYTYIHTLFFMFTKYMQLQTLFSTAMCLIGSLP
jgi:hypothetical protein